MEFQAIKNNRLSRMSMSQMRASGVTENRGNADAVKYHHGGISSEIQNIFDARNGLLNELYCENMVKGDHKAMMTIGVCLPHDITIGYFKQICKEVGKPIQVFTRMQQRKENNNEICFIPSLHYRIQNCTIVFWIFQEPNHKQLQSKKQINKCLEIFIAFPQIILTNLSMFQLIKSKKVSLPKLLNYQQHIILLTNPNQQLPGFSSKEDADKFRISEVKSVDAAILKPLIWLTLRKNSLRCFQQPLRINMHLLESLNLVFSFHNKQKCDLSSEENITEILHMTASKYLSEEVERQYEALWQSMRNAPPRNERQLETELNDYEETCLREVRRNIHMLPLPEQQKKYFEPAEKIISVNSQQILANNRQQIKKQNNQVLSELYQKLLGQFDKGRYSNTKQKTQLMAHDLQFMMTEYQKKAIQSNSLFWVFNTFMRNNRHKYYLKIQSLEEQTDHTKKNQNFDEIFDKIEMKKKVLLTLEKEIRNLEHKKNAIEKDNEHLKRLQKQLNEKPNFQSEYDQLQQADSIKSIRPAPLSSVSPRKNSSNVVFNSPKYQGKDKTQKMVKKRKCMYCCPIC